MPYFLFVVFRIENTIGIFYFWKTNIGTFSLAMQQYSLLYFKQSLTKAVLITLIKSAFRIWCYSLTYMLRLNPEGLATQFLRADLASQQIYYFIFSLFQHGNPRMLFSWSRQGLGTNLQSKERWRISMWKMSQRFWNEIGIRFDIDSGIASN